MANWDWNLFLAINHLAGKLAWADRLGIFLAADAFALFAVLLVALWFLPAVADLRRSRQRYVVNAMIAAGAALVTAHSISVLFYRARPFVAHSVNLLISHGADSSFPSDHTAFAFVVVAALWPVLGRTRWVWLALAVAIGLARVFVGVHYPTDVLGGAALGVLWGSLALAYAPVLEQFESPVLERLARWRLA